MEQRHSVALGNLLPAPAGVTVVVGTQPVDDSQLPPSLLASAPRETWIELPAFDRGAIQRWVRKHSGHFQLSSTDDQDYFFGELIRALTDQSAGHPLHLRVTLQALHEQNLPINASTIRSMPACAHRNIVSYYDALWNSLTEPARAVLQRMVAGG